MSKKATNNKIQNKKKKLKNKTKQHAQNFKQLTPIEHILSLFSFVICHRA